MSLLASVGVNIPDESTRGVTVFTEQTDISLHTVLRSPLADVRENGEGKLLVISPQLDAAVSGNNQVPEQLVAAILQALAHFFRGKPELRINNVLCGSRPIPGGKLPVVGIIPGYAGLSVAFTHSGATVGLLIGQLLADELLERTRSSLLEKFRPERFFIS